MSLDFVQPSLYTLVIEALQYSLFRSRFDLERASTSAKTIFALVAGPCVLLLSTHPVPTFVVGTTDRSGIAKVPRISSPAQTPKHLPRIYIPQGKSNSGGGRKCDRVGFLH